MNRSKRIVLSSIVAVGVLGGGVAVASAVGGDDDTNEPAITGSIDAPAEADEQTDAQEETALQELATISAEDAQAAALAAVPGTARTVELDDEDGFVVYDVDVSTDAGIVEVTVDAGTGDVLQQEADDDTDDDVDDTDDQDD